MGRAVSTPTAPLTQVLRLFAAAAIIPATAGSAYFLALNLDGTSTTIGANGSAFGVVLVVAMVFVSSFVAKRDGWSERAAVSLVLSAAYFLLTWVEFGDASSSADAAPHLVWYAACVVAFAPAVVLMVASERAWQERSGLWTTGRRPRTTPF